MGRPSIEDLRIVQQTEEAVETLKWVLVKSGMSSTAATQKADEIYGIVADYGAVLTEFERRSTTALPQSLLPYNKNKIKAAIHMLLAVNPGAEFRNALGAGYVELAGFVPDKEAKIVAEYCEWGRRCPTNPDLDAKLTQLKDSPSDKTYSERITQLASQDPELAESFYKHAESVHKHAKLISLIDADKVGVIHDRISAESKVLLEELNSFPWGEKRFEQIESTAQRDYWSVALSLFFLALVVIVLLWA